MYGEKNLTATTQQCWEQYWTSPGSSTPQSSSCTATYNPSQKTIKLNKPDMWDTTGEVGTSGLLDMDEQSQDDQLEPTYSSSVLIWDVALKTCWEQWTIGRGVKRGSGISMLIAWHDGDDIYICIYFFSIFFFICNLRIFMTFSSFKLVLISSSVHKESSWLFATPLHVLRELRG